MNIETVPGRLIIDQTEARADLGFKTIPRLVAENAADAKRIAMEELPEEFGKAMT